jgi:hypothetical protein
MNAVRWLLLSLSLWGLRAQALKSDDTIYVKARNTKLLLAPTASAEVKAVLRVGDVLQWKAKEANGFHAVRLPGKDTVYFVYGANLSLAAPKQEQWATAGTSVDTRAFASSGAATKGLSEGAFQMAVSDAQLEKAARDLLALEALQAEVTDVEVDAHLREAKLAVEPAP